MGQLVLNNMEFYAHHGHYKEERIIGGRFSIDLVIDTDTDKAADSDDLKDAVDYSRVYEAVKTEMAVPSNLIEHLAQRIMNSVYGISGNITKITVTVSKLNPSIGGQMSSFSVILTK
jgi:dihydroneopterin aldolase